MSDTLIIAGNTYTNVAGFKATDNNSNIKTYIRPEGTKSITVNETGIDVTNYASVDVNVPVGGTINNQSNKTVTPTKSQQIITYDSGYTGLAQVTVSAIPAAYITTSDADAIAANILLNKTAYVNGSKITGTMANNGATGGTITTQGGTYTIPAGYTSGGTVTVSLAAGSTTASNISGAAFEETTGDYGFRTSVQIQPGYYASATTVTKDFSSMLPAPDTEGTAAQVLAGYDLYNHDGQLISGTMTNNSIGTITLDQTTTSYTIPAGYHDGTGKVQHTTVNIPDPTISVNSNTGVITASGSWTRGFTTDNSYSKTYSLSTQAAATITPSETLQTAVAAGKYTTGIVTVAAIPNDYVGSGITQRSSSDLSASGATVTAPAGYYSTAASKSVASMTLPTAATSSASSGYSSKAIITPSTSAQYINIPTGYNGTASYYTISGDADLIAGNIKSGVQIFGVTGTYAGLDTSDATATAGDILSGKTAYVNGTKITGAIPELTQYTSDHGKYYLTENGQRKWHIYGIIDTNYGGVVYPGTRIETSEFSFNAIPANTVIIPTTSEQTIGGENYMMEGAITIAAVPTMTLPTAASSTRSGTTKATIGRSTSAQYINIPIGYNDTAASYTISAVANGSATAPASISGTAATVSTGTNTLTLTKSVSVTPSVTAGYISSGTAGNSSVTLTANVTTKAAATITPGTTNQTIASGTYLTGTQTIVGDADLIASNIKSGVQIFNVTGTYSGLDTSDATATAADIVSGKTAYVDGREVEGSLVVQTYYTGSTVPSSSLGINGDIYLQS